MQNELIPDGGYSRNVQGTWTIRRRIIFSSLIFCAFCIAYILFFGDDTRLNESIILGAFGLAGTVIGAYCFGAVWDDKTKREHTIGGPQNEFTFEKPKQSKNVVQPTDERRKRAKDRLEKMKRNKIKVDNPDA